MRDGQSPAIALVRSRKRQFQGVLVGAAALLLLLGGVGYYFVIQALKRPTVYWLPDGGLQINGTLDDVYVVTHLITVDEAAEVVLPAPQLVITDSGAAWLSAKGLQEMPWKNGRGEPVSAPVPGTPLRAVYRCVRCTTAPWSRHLPGRWGSEGARSLFLTGAFLGVALQGRQGRDG